MRSNGHKLANMNVAIILLSVIGCIFGHRWYKGKVYTPRSRFLWTGTRGGSNSGRVGSVNTGIHFTAPKIEASKGHEKCPENWVRFQGHCYYFSEKADKTWHEARALCRSLEGWLVQIESLEESNFIRRQIIVRNYPTTEDVHIGGQNLADLNQWVWDATNEPICSPGDANCTTFTDWGTPSANNTRFRCLELKPLVDPNLMWRWNGGGCPYPEFYICEKAPGCSPKFECCGRMNSNRPWY